MPRRKAKSKAKIKRTTRRIITPLDPESAHAGILDLPNELLLMIFKDLAHSDLYSLALLCKRLHHFSIRAYFSASHSGVTLNNTGTVAIYLCSVPHRTLPFLRLATFITSIQSLDCSISCGFVGQIRGIQRLVSRMQSVHSVTLHIGINEPYYSDFSVGQAHIALWTLVDTLADKTCQNLTIKGGSGWERYYAWPSFKTEIRTLSRLGHVEIHDTYVFSPKLIDWTVNTLNKSPVNTLTLSLSPREPDLWAKILTHLTLPSLRHLSICSTCLPFDVLSGFLLRHPLIVRLTIDQPTLIPAHVARLPREALPHMSFLDASASYLCHLLAPLHMFPALQSVTVKHRSPRLSPAGNTRALFNILTVLCHHEKITHLTFPLDVIYLTARCSSRNRPECGLHYITHLDLGNLHEGLTENMKAVLPCWLGLFPALQSVKFNVWMRMSIRQMKDFVKTIADACPRMQTVGFGYFNTHTVAAWLELPDD